MVRIIVSVLGQSAAISAVCAHSAPLNSRILSTPVWNQSVSFHSPTCRCRLVLSVSILGIIALDVSSCVLLVQIWGPANSLKSSCFLFHYHHPRGSTTGGSIVCKCNLNDHSLPAATRSQKLVLQPSIASTNARGVFVRTALTTWPRRNPSFHRRRMCFISGFREVTAAARCAAASASLLAAITLGSGITLGGP